MLFQSEKKNLIYQVLWLFLIIITPHFIFAQSYTSPLASEGGVDTHLYKCDTVMFESAVMEDGSPAVEARSFNAGLSMLHSPYLSMLYVPLKYGLNDNFQISFSLPYLTKTLVYNDTHYIKSGYGDTMLGLTASLSPFDAFTSSTTARMTLPTGNVNAQDFNYYIPMGYGGYTASIQETISTNDFDAIIMDIRLFVSGVYIYYFTSNQQIDQVTKYTFDKNYSWSVLGGIEFGLTGNLAVQLKGNYINIPERRYKDSSTGGSWTDADDSVKQVNILPFIRYQFTEDISGQAGIIYPLKTVQDSDLTTTYDPEWKIAMGIEKRFCDGGSTAAENGSKTGSNSSMDENNIKADPNQKKTNSKKKTRRKKKRR